MSCTDNEIYEFDFLKDLFRKCILLHLFTGTFTMSFIQAQQTASMKGNHENKALAEWTTLRANNNRDGRVISTGEFQDNARLSQSMDFSTSDAYFELLPAHTNSQVHYSKRKISNSNSLCMANLDGDGKLWVVELSLRKSDSEQVLFAYDPVTGDVHKTFSMEISGAMPVACDMNADGRDEIVVSNATGVYSIGTKNGKPSVMWKYLAKGCGPAVVQMRMQMVSSRSSLLHRTVKY